MNHTPGPWNDNGIKDSTDPEARQAKAVWTLHGSIPICTTDFSVGKYKAVDPETQTANARLIAAAPDLLAALRAVADSFINSAGVVFVQPDVAKQARAAIAKATGQTP